jgi:hypothetical protein
MGPTQCNIPCVYVYIYAFFGIVRETEIKSQNPVVSIFRVGEQSPAFKVAAANNRLHGAEPFLRSRQLCSYSRISKHSMKPERSLKSSHEYFTGPYLEPD